MPWSDDDYKLKPEQQERLRRYAIEQILLILIRYVIDGSDQPDARRAEFAKVFEARASDFSLQGVPPEVEQAGRELMIQHGLELLSGLLPRA